jgi:hypothetical protein
LLRRKNFSVNSVAGGTSSRSYTDEDAHVLKRPVGVAPNVEQEAKWIDYQPG